MMMPYYDHAGITIYNADCRDVLPMLSDVSFLFSDPPYGINYQSNHNHNRSGKWSKWRRKNNFNSIYGDEEPFNPSHLFQYEKIALFGGNYFSSRLPDSRCWIIWDKREGMSPNSFADCELIWTTFEKPSRIFRHLWSGLVRRGEENVSNQPKFHPHQKPIDLCMKIIQYSDTPNGDLIVDPYMGSGSIALAAKRLGYPLVGVEIEERYCEIAARRLSQEVMELRT